MFGDCREDLVNVRCGLFLASSKHLTKHIQTFLKRSVGLDLAERSTKSRNVRESARHRKSRGSQVIVQERNKSVNQLIDLALQIRRIVHESDW